jgi:hypothetical protein
MAVTYTNRKGYRKYKHYIGTLCSQSFRPRTASHAQTRDWLFLDRPAPAWHKKGERRSPLHAKPHVSSWIKLAAAARGGADYGLLARNGQVAYNRN